MRVTALACGALLAGARAAPAQDLVRLAPRGNEIGTESRAEQWGAEGTPPSRTVTVGEWITLSLNGMLVSPRMLSWTVTLRPYAGQQSAAAKSAEVDSRNLGLSFGASLLAGFPVSASLHAHRSAGRQAAAAGGNSDFRTSSSGATLQWRNDPMPVTLSLSRRVTEDAWTSAPHLPPLRRDETLNAMRLEARSSKLSLVLERLGLDDRLGNLDFSSSGATADHTLRWGHGSWLATQLQAERRDGSFPYRRAGGGARISVRHTPKLSSQAHLDHRSGTASGLDVRHDARGLEMRYRARDWITTSAYVSADRGTAGRSGTAATRLGARGEAARTVRGVQVTAGAALLSENVELEGEDAWTHVFAEMHRIDASRGFDLLQRGIDASSIQLRSADQQVLYSSGIDYTVLAAGDAVRIQLLPGGRLSPNDVVLVDFRFATPGKGEFTVVGLSGDMTLSAGGAVLSWQEGLRDVVSVSTADGATTGGRDRGLGLNVSRETRLGRVSVTASRRSRTRSQADVSSRDLHLGWTPATGSGGRLTLGTRWAASHTGSRRLTSLSTDASLTWRVSGNLQFLLGGERWLWVPDQAADERYTTVTSEVSLRLDLVDITARYVFQRRTVAAASSQHRVTFRLVRHF